MEKIMEEVLAQLRALTNEVKGYGQRLKTLESSVNTIKEEYGQKLSTMESTVNTIKEDQGQKLKSLENNVHSMMEEYSQMLRSTLEYREIRKLELDHLKHKISKVAGILKGFDNSLEMLKKVD